MGRPIESCSWDSVFGCVITSSNWWHQVYNSQANYLALADLAILSGLVYNLETITAIIS